MSISKPHFLLFSDAQQGSSRTECSGRWRFVLESCHSKRKIEATDTEPDGEHQRLELLAFVRGLEALDQPSRVTLVTASRYVNRGLRFGLEEWRDNGWRWDRFGSRVHVKNHDLWQRVDRALRFHTVECRWWRRDRATESRQATRDAAHLSDDPIERDSTSNIRSGAPPIFRSFLRFLSSLLSLVTGRPPRRPNWRPRLAF